MSTEISRLSTSDYASVDGLMKKNARWVGFLPKPALLHSLEEGRVFGAKSQKGELAGYLLFLQNARRFRITHLCVATNFRRQGIARRLVEYLKTTATSQKVIQLNCRRDFPAHEMWPSLGFVPTGEKRGRSSAGHLLNCWCLTLAKDDRLSLFQAKVSDEAVDVVIDSQVFFDVDEDNGVGSKVSKALLADFLLESLNFWITDELFLEIDRQREPSKRNHSKQRAHTFPQVHHSRKQVLHYETVLGEILHSGTPSQESDIRQLAKTAASDVGAFVTRDKALLKKASEISRLIGIRVLDPVSLLIQVHELSDKQSYYSSPVSGLTLEWRRMSSLDLADFPFESFLTQGERKSQVRSRLDSYLAQPESLSCEVLWSEGKAVALRVIERARDRFLRIHFARVAATLDRRLFERYLGASFLYRALEEDMKMVSIDRDAIPESLWPDLKEIGYVECGRTLVRFCLPMCKDRNEIMEFIEGLCSESIEYYKEIPNSKLGEYCSPLNVGSGKPCFLVPIRPGYSISLINSYQSANTLFGGQDPVLLRWENVYYRSKSHPKSVSSPASILWYVSGRKEFIAVSQLDDVEVGTPKSLYKKYRKLGILDWRDLQKMTDNDTDKEIMALRFSHTFPFRHPISFPKYRAICKEFSADPWVRSLRKIPTSIYQKLFELGFN